MKARKVIQALEVIRYNAVVDRQRWEESLRSVTAGHEAAVNNEAVIREELETARELNIILRGITNRVEIVRYVRAGRDVTSCCPHPFVFEEPGYPGTDGHDDSYCGRRRCLICGFDELEDQPKNGVYAVLSLDKSTRYVTQELSEGFSGRSCWVRGEFPKESLLEALLLPRHRTVAGKYGIKMKFRNQRK